MPAEATFTEQENDRMREVAKILIERFGSQRKVADALGISQPAVGAFVAGKYGIGSKTAERLADLADMTMDQLLGRTIANLIPKDPFPNRQPVIDFARRVGYPEETIKKLRSARPANDRDQPSTVWARLLVMINEIDALPFTHAGDSATRRLR